MCLPSELTNLKRQHKPSLIGAHRSPGREAGRDVPTSQGEKLRLRKENGWLSLGARPAAEVLQPIVLAPAARGGCCVLLAERLDE